MGLRNVVCSPSLYCFLLSAIHVGALVAAFAVDSESCWNPPMAYLLSIMSFALVGFAGITYALRHHDFWHELKRNEFQKFKDDWSFHVCWSIVASLLVPAQTTGFFVTANGCDQSIPPLVLFLTMSSCLLTWPWGVTKIYLWYKSPTSIFKRIGDRSRDKAARKTLVQSLNMPDSLKKFKLLYFKVDWPTEYTSPIVLKYIAKHASYIVPEVPPREIDDSFSWDQSNDCLHDSHTDLRLITWNFFHKHTKRCCKICKCILQPREIAVDLQCCSHLFSVDRFHLTCLEKAASASTDVFCYWKEKDMNITELLAKMALQSK